jgi:hypothetical protein
MGYTDDDIKRLAMLREWLEKQISDKEEELERLRSGRRLVLLRLSRLRRIPLRV